MTKCYKCKSIKENQEFGHNSTRPNGLQDRCKPCRKISGKKSYKKNIKKILKYRELHKEKQKEYHKAWRLENAQKIKEDANKYYGAHKEQRIDYQNDYYLYHKKERVSYQGQYIKNRRKNDKLFNFESNLRSRTSAAFRGKDKSQKNP
jgi:hypothetical protein